MTFPAKDGDVFLLCSDGLTTMVSDDEIQQILTHARSLRAAVKELVDAANRGGGRDNITAVAFRLADADAKEGEESATLISRTAEQAGLTRERMRDATDRMRGRGPMPAPPRRRRYLGWAVAILATIVIVGGGFLVARSIYFLGTDDAGNVALYRGVPYTLPLGISLYSKQYSIPVQEGTLSEERQKAVTGHTWRSHGDATDLIDDIKLRPTEGLPPPPAPPPAKKKKKSGTNSKGRQAKKS
jgi:PPM family protein phosphatase